MTLTQYSLAALTVLDLPPPDMIAVAAEAGYDCVGLRLLPAMPNGIAYTLMDDPARLRATLRAIEATGIQVADVEVVVLRPETSVVDFEPFLEVGQRLGARHALVAGYDPERDRLVQTFGAFCDLATRFGLTADLEFMPWTNVPDLKTAKQVVQAVGCLNAGVLIDALHFDRSGSSISDLTMVPSSSLHFWQICDGPAEKPQTLEALLHTARCERNFPGEGGIDLQALVQALPTDIPVSVEVPTETLARTTGHLERAKRALKATKNVIECSRDVRLSAACPS